MQFSLRGFFFASFIMSFIKEISLWNLDLFLLDFSIYNKSNFFEKNKKTYKFDGDFIKSYQISCQIYPSMSPLSQYIKKLVSFTKYSWYLPHNVNEFCVWVNFVARIWCSCCFLSSSSLNESDDWTDSIASSITV